MPNQWNQNDLIRLTQDCELGKEGDTLLVLSVDGDYMAVRLSRASMGHVEWTGRDYAFAVKVGEGDLAAAIASVARALLSTSEKAPDVRGVPMRLVNQSLFDELMLLTGGAS